MLQCLESNGRAFNEGKDYSSPEYDPFALKMGQLTVYRFRVRCACEGQSTIFGPDCARMKPYEEQIWPAFMGIKGDSKENVRL